MSLLGRLQLRRGVGIPRSRRSLLFHGAHTDASAHLFSSRGMSVVAALTDYKRCSSPSVVAGLVGNEEKNQDLFVQHLDSDPVLIRCPPKVSYTLAVLELLARRGSTSDALYEKIAQLVTKSRDDEVHHVTYLDKLSLRLFSKSNEVGLRLWPAAELMACFVASPRRVWRRVVELGAGCGLVGLAIASFCQFESVVLTDGDANVLRNLDYNVELNGFLDDDGVSVQLLDWHDSVDPPSAGEEDAVFAADCVYDVEDARALARVASAYAKKSWSVYLANAIRNDQTWKAAEEAFGREGLNIKDVTEDAIASIEKRSKTTMIISEERWRETKREACLGQLKIVTLSTI